MNCMIDGKTLLAAVNATKAVVRPKSALPILHHVLIGVNGSLDVSGTDLKTSIRSVSTSGFSHDGPNFAFTADAKRLQAIARAAKGSVVEFSIDPDHDFDKIGQNVVTVKYNGVAESLFGHDPQSFPQIRTEYKATVTLPGDEFRNALSQVFDTISVDQARYNLTGALMEIKGGIGRLIATDGRRLHCSGLLRIGCVENFTGIIPIAALRQVKRIMSKGWIELRVDSNHCEFSQDGVSVSTQLIDETFPNYDMVVPKKHPFTFTVDKAQLRGALDRATKVCTERFNCVRFHFDGSGRLFLVAIVPDSGEFRESVPADMVRGELAWDNGFEGQTGGTYEPFDIAFNPDFVIDAIDAMPGDRIEFTLKDCNSAGLITPIDGSPSSALAVIMPIRI